MSTRAKSVKNGSKSRARALLGQEFTGRAKKLLDLLTTGDLEAAVKVWRDGLTASRRFWNPAAKEWIEEPDLKERRECAMAIAAYMEGKPIERQIQVGGSFEDFDKLLGRIRASPAAMREIGDAIDVRAMPTTKSESP